jgi:hypothetical protein
MKVKIIINVNGNAAFEESPALEVARILGEVVKKIEANRLDCGWSVLNIEVGEAIKLYDINGNAVGTFEVKK